VYCGALSAPVQRVPAPLMIEIERRGDVGLLRVQGDFQTGEDPDYLRAKMDEIVALKCTKVLADFRDVRSVGSTGLSFLVGLYRTSGGRFVLASIQPRVREALEITRLSTVIRLAEDVEQGLAALRSED
jgi:anti-anti-sigma factor